MAGRVIELVLPRRGVVARARLCDDEAPRTCQLIWERLPLRAETIHAMFSGCELYVVFPWEEPVPPGENLTQCTDGGDLFFYLAAGRDGRPTTGEIAVYYDRDAEPTGGAGLMVGTLFATIVENREGFAAACEAIWHDGAEELLVRRAEDPR